MAVVVMTREMGTLGKDVARYFARRLKYHVVHAELAEEGNRRARQGEESEVYRFLEGSQEEIENWRRSHPGGYLSSEEIFEIALEGNVLIRGWGATRLLRSIPNVLSLRVCAPLDFRIKNMQQRLGVDEVHARREIERSDAAHSSILMRLFNVDWTDPLQYDIVLNSGHLSPKVCADILCDTVVSPAFAETEESRGKLKDCLLEARIRSALTGNPQLQRSSRHVHVSVEDAKVRLYGLVTNAFARKEAEALAEAQVGVRELVNEIAYTSRFD